MDGFIIIGNGGAVSYEEIFPLIKENKMWLGAGKGMGGKAMEFIVDASIYDASKGSVNRIENGKCYVGVMMCTWFTNIDHTKRNTPLDLYKKYNAEEYPKYDNYDAIEVSRVENIPMDYDGIMGVPISFLDKYCPSQFEIVGMAAGNSAVNEFGILANYKKHEKDRGGCGVVNGERVYARFLIRKVKERRKKDFLIIGPAAALGYHTLFHLFADKVIKAGHKGHKERIGLMFDTDTGDKFQTAYWYTTLKVTDFDREFTLTKTYDPKKYPHYDNYPDIIEVRRCDDIPIDYTGIMGVPTSFFRYHPELDYEVLELNDKCRIDGKQMFKRLFIRRKNYERLHHHR